jgi:hypothetical protein
LSIIFELILKKQPIRTLHPIFKEVELNKNNFEDLNKPFLLVKDTFKNTFKKTIKEKYEEKILESHHLVLYKFYKFLVST